jgi:thymidylate synthase (FAD)
MTREADEIKGKYFRVLDHGFISLVDYMGDDLAVLQAARVSYGAGTKGTKSDRGLLRYMLKHKHTSPFEQVILKFHVKLPIFVARQLIRHRTASVNEYSMRYSLPVMQFYNPSQNDLGIQSKMNKQGRSEVLPSDLACAIQERWKEQQLSSIEFYEYLVNQEIDLARELARIGLPVSLYTEWYWTIDLHNLLHFLTLRSDSHAQWEIQQYSNLKAAIVKRVAPISYEAWIDYQFRAHTFSRMEMVVILKHLSGTMKGTLAEECLSLGMSNRETTEFLEVFNVGSLEFFQRPVDFELNPADGLDGEVLSEEAQKFIPRSL